jgi:hypothetical protein
MVWRRNARTNDLEVQPEFPAFPPGAPPQYVLLCQLCLLEEYNKRPSFEQVSVGAGSWGRGVGGGLRLWFGGLDVFSTFTR